MSLTSFGILTNFDHSQHTWKTFRSRLTQWFIANDIDTVKDPAGVKRRAILLSAFADGTYKLAADLALPKDLQDVPYEDILRLLDTHFTPKQVGFGERHKFYAANQLSTESASEWAARLRGLTAQCNFCNVEEALRDKFIMGMLPGAEKERLYVQDLTGMTLAKAVELVENLRSAGAAAATSSSAAADQPLYKIDNRAFRVRAKSDKVKCKVCGYTNHKTEECRFAQYTCKKCNVKGHLRRMCKSLKYVVTDDAEEGDDDDGKLHNIRSLRGEPLIETVCINGIKLSFEIDSGSAVTVISERSYKTHFANVPLSFTKKKLISYTGEVLECVGRLVMSLEWRGRAHDLQVYVVRDGGPPLLGRDFISKFELQLAPVYNCKQTVVNSASLDQLYPRIFSGELGQFNKHTVTLNLKAGAKPIFFKARPMPFALREKVDKEIDKLIGLGVLRPVAQSEYASPIVPVLKRDGSVRLCVDYSVSINKQLVIDQYPLPTINELFSKLHGGEQFTKLDLSMAYNQFLLDDESQKLTCINTHRGLFVFTRLVFGLSSAPAIFQRAMENLLAGMNGVLCLLDDVLITGQDRSEHLDRLHQVLQRLQDAGLVLQKDKCEYFKNEISYLGYVINRDGLKKSPEKIKAITQAPIPTNVNQLQSFLGLVNYYRCFVSGASTILSPLYELLKKSVKWRWSKIENEAFVRIKNMLTSDQVLAHFNMNAKIILTVDASPSGLGAILSQVDNDNQEKPIAFASRTLNSAEKRYSQIQKEATAIVFGVRRFHQYLYGRSTPFHLRTDHKPLLSIFGPHKGVPEVSANRLQRYALFLSGYNYVIEYVKSKDNCADYLSRASLPVTHSPAEARNDTDADTGDRAAYVRFVVNGSLPITASELRDATKRDPVLISVTNYVLNGWPKKIKDKRIRPYFLCRLQMSYENGCLLRGYKAVIPESLRQRVLCELHTSHLGIVKTKAEARARLWFPGIDEALEKLIAACDVCGQMRPSPPRAPVAPWPYPPHPFHRVHLDFLGPLNERMYLVIVDAYSKWVEVYEMNTCTTAAVIDRMYEYMSRFGLPQTVVTDNGIAFCSQDFKLFCKLNGISHMTSPPYHPASNGQAESYVKIAKKGIKTSILSSKCVRDSKLNLLKYLFDYRNSVHSITNTSPAQLVFGRKLRSRLDILKPSLSPPLSAELANSVQSKQCSQVKSRGGKYVFFTPGQYVLYKKYSNQNKFSWCKGKIIQALGKMLYLIKDCITFSTTRKHKNQVMLFKGNPDNNSNGQPWDVLDIATTATDPPPQPIPQPQTSSPSEDSGAAGLGEEDDHPEVSPSTDINPPLYESLGCDDTSGVTMTRGVRRPANSDDDQFYEAEGTETPGGPSEQLESRKIDQRQRRVRPKVDYSKFF